MQKPVVIKRLQEQAEENPTLMLGVAAAATASVAKLIDAVSSARSKKAYAKVMNQAAKNYKNKK